MPKIIALTCPVCGAPLGGEGSRCSYCGSLVAITTDFVRLEASQLNRSVVNEHIAKYRATVRRDPNDEAAHYGLGVAYFNLGLFEEAADELAQAARLVPENPHIQTQLAVVYAELARQGKAGAEADAADRVERALQLDPRHADALVLRADLSVRRGDWSSAINDLRLAVDAGAPAAGAALGSALVDRASASITAGNWSEGVAYLRDAMPLNPTAAKPLLVGVLQANENLLTTPLLDVLQPVIAPAPRPQPSQGVPARASAGRAGAKAFGKLLGGAFVVFVVAAIVIGNQPRDSGLTTVMALVVLAALLAMVASPVVGVVVWRRAKGRTADPSPTGIPDAAPTHAARNRREHRLALRTALLSGAIDDPDLLVNAATRVARTRDELASQRAKGRR